MRVNVTFEIPESAAARAPWLAGPALLAALRAHGAALGPSSRTVSPPLRGDWIERTSYPTHELHDTRALAQAAARHPSHARHPLRAPRSGHAGHHEQYIAHGSLRVPCDANRLFNEAVRYLEHDSAMRTVIAKVEHSRTELTLRIVHNGADRYEPDSHTVVWDPLSALRTTAGGRQTPALGLGHELAHAAAGPSVLDRGMRTRLRGYDNAEERRVVRGAEAHAARTLGEAARSDHRGTCYDVASPVVCRLAA